MCFSGETDPAIYFDTRSMSLEVGNTKNLTVVLRHSFPWNTTLVFTYRNLDGKFLNVTSDKNSIVHPLEPFTVTNGSDTPVLRKVTAIRPGHVYIGLNESEINHNISGLGQVLCDVAVMHQRWLSVVEVVVGWMYFAAWTISFYPQVFLNWRRKSVVGLNLDFLFLNLTGFFIYSVFNITLYASPVIKDLYHRLYPIGEIPVQMNDIFFSVHAFLICIVTGIQVLIYERGGQRISRVCIVILCLIGIYSAINIVLAGAGVFTWLTFLYNISYVKLFITLVKYIPQAVMNCRRRSTVGWSIGNICLDMTGGLLSILQMFIIAYNFDDYGSVFGSPTKVGLGLFSVVFDVFFMVQHWCLFANAEHLVDSVDESGSHSPQLSPHTESGEGDIWGQVTRAAAVYRRASDESALIKQLKSTKTETSPA
ncbi:Cystinosin [Fasciolopsis buskii]|uniref:Cystinosin n=1 Tax=Fasciolopsis buskii TaxID=27845 RepID=A0A8E0VGG3_9TREM|nr:Cystinosin [Fasciolopsis buski]